MSVALPACSDASMKFASNDIPCDVESFSAWRYSSATCECCYLLKNSLTMQVCGVAGEKQSLMAKHGIGASVPRKEDDRFLRGRAQYVADIRMAGTREVAFVRSPVAHARLKEVNVPEQFRNVVFTARHLTGVRPIISAPPLKGFKYSVEPILAADKVRYVGEMVAMCLASSRAEAEDIASAVALEFEELPAVTDMLAACQPGSPLVHEEWGDNIFVEFSENGPVDEVAKTAAIKVTRKIRTA